MHYKARETTNPAAERQKEMTKCTKDVYELFRKTTNVFSIIFN